MRKRIFSIVFAFLMVTSVSAAPAQAQTIDSADQCGGLIEFIRNAASLGLTGTTTCDTNDQIDQMKELDGQQEHLDIYNSALAEKSSDEEFLSVYENYAQDTEGPAWMKMQVAVAEAYQNGSSKAVAKSKAREAIAQYYVTKQMNLISRWNSSVSNAEYLQETATNETNLSDTAVTVDTIGRNGNPIEESDSLRWNRRNYDIGAHTATVTLVDDTTATTNSIYIDIATDKLNAGDWEPHNYEGNYTITTSPGVFTTDFNGLLVEKPNSNYENKRFVDFGEFKSAWNSIETRNNDLQNEAENFVDATYGDFDTGEANASDVISANTAMFEYGTENDENSSLYDSTAALATMGFDTPNMSTTGTMDVDYQGNTYTGIVMARNAPNGSWQTGTTYNTSNIEGPVFLATTDAQKIDFEETA